ncbi:prolyl endopeptidase [Tribonema minus]|uniref:Prolyl endopeptidase n=1 Tax=Tribonema minus TaxID=303371 RepID=A0A835YIC5_9STRA|nr:prolyl endopeptidase [Tribonema minus]
MHVVLRASSPDEHTLTRIAHGRLPTFGKFKYPVTRRCDHTDNWHGEEVPDPYRWLENPDDEEVQTWVDAQNECTFAYFNANLEPQRRLFCERMTALYSYDKYGCPMQYGDLYFFYKKTGLQNQFVLYKQAGLNEEPTVLLDPNTMSDDGTAALQGHYFTEDGSKLAYTVSMRGSDWYSIHVMDVATGKELPDRIDWCKFSSVAWNKTGTGFFYSKFPPPEGLQGKEGKSAGTEVDAVEGNKVFYHRLGTDAAEDQLVYEAGAENNKWLLSCESSDDYQTLLINIHDSCDPVNRLFYLDMSRFDGASVATLGRLVKLVDKFENKYSYITNEGRTFWFLTNLDAPRYKVIKMTLPPAGSPMEADPASLALVPRVDVVQQDSVAVLEGAYAVANDRLVLLYMRDAYEQLEICDLNGGDRRSIQLPSIGSIEGISAKKTKNEMFFKFVNFQDAGTTYRCEITRKQDGKIEISRDVFKRTVVPGLNPDDFETKQVRFKSTDGTSVPMFIVGSKGQRGAAPCLLYGYGGFNISITPSFSLSRLIFIKNFGGRVCVANIRGGGEYGEDWHDAGVGANKQNVFDDFISGAKYLCTINLTTPAQLAINGGSNGGLLVGACINQQPELFAAAVAQVGVMDMLRFHKFTIGYAWCSDYGNPDDDKNKYKVLRAYSPVHNVAPDAGRYPATLLTTGDHDDRVVPLHSYKYAAMLQSVIGSRKGENNPLLIRIDTRSGHGAGKPTSKVIEESSDIWAFIARHTGAVWRD